MSYTVQKYNAPLGFSSQGTVRNYTVKYIVESTTEYDMNLRGALAADGMPQIGDAYEYDAGSFVSNHPELEEHSFLTGKTIWIFSVSYSSNSTMAGVSGYTDPTSEPPKITFGYVKYTIPFELSYKRGDSNGKPSKPVLTSSKCKYDPPATTEIVNGLINIQYNSRSWSPYWITEYINTINAVSVTVAGCSIDGGNGKINELGASSAYDTKGNLYWVISAQIETSKSGFKKKILDQCSMAYNSKNELDNIYVEMTVNEDGTKTSVKKCKSDIAGTAKEFKTKLQNGLIEPANEPSLLDGHGKILAESANPVYNEEEAYYDTFWTALKLPKTYKG